MQLKFDKFCHVWNLLNSTDDSISKWNLLAQINGSPYICGSNISVSILYTKLFEYQKEAVAAPKYW